MLTIVVPDWRTRFPEGRKRLSELCRQCPVCQKIKQPQRLHGPSDVWHHLHGVRPYGSISMDQFGPFPPDEWGNTYLQGMLCQLTRIGMGVPTKNVTGEAAAYALCHWVQVFGWPDTLRSDKGPAMTSVKVTGRTETESLDGRATLAVTPHPLRYASRDPYH